MSRLLFDWRNCSRMHLAFLIMFYLDVSCSRMRLVSLIMFSLDVSQGTAKVFFHLCLWLSVVGGGVSGDSSFFWWSYDF